MMLSAFVVLFLEAKNMSAQGRWLNKHLLNLS